MIDFLRGAIKYYLSNIFPNKKMAIEQSESGLASIGTEQRSLKEFRIGLCPVVENFRQNTKKGS